MKLILLLILIIAYYPTQPVLEYPTIDLRFHGADLAIITPDRIEAYYYDPKTKTNVLMWERRRYDR
jgi:hypothetical protein